MPTGATNKQSRMFRWRLSHQDESVLQQIAEEMETEGAYELRKSDGTLNLSGVLVRLLRKEAKARGIVSKPTS